MSNLDQYPSAQDMARMAVVTFVGLEGEQLATPRVLYCGPNVDRAALEGGQALHHFGRVRMQEPAARVARMAPGSAAVSISMLPRVRQLMAEDPMRPIVIVSPTGDKMQQRMYIRRPR